MPSEIQLNEFEKLLVQLAKDEVRFIMVGGLAVITNGYDRFTSDVDILLDHNPVNLRKTIDSLSTYGQGYARELKIEDFVFQEGCIRVNEEFPIDLFVQMKGRKYQDMIGDTLRIMVEGQTISYLSPKQLIFLKENSYRDKDKLDVNAMQTVLDEERRQSGQTPTLWDHLRSFFSLRRKS